MKQVKKFNAYNDNNEEVRQATEFILGQEEVFDDKRISEVTLTGEVGKYHATIDKNDDGSTTITYRRRGRGRPRLEGDAKAAADKKRADYLREHNRLYARQRRQRERDAREMAEPILFPAVDYFADCFRVVHCLPSITMAEDELTTRIATKMAQLIINFLI